MNDTDDNLTPPVSDDDIFNINVSLNEEGGERRRDERAKRRRRRKRKEKKDNDEEDNGEPHNDSDPNNTSAPQESNKKTRKKGTVESAAANLQNPSDPIIPDFDPSTLVAAFTRCVGAATNCGVDDAGSGDSKSVHSRTPLPQLSDSYAPKVEGGPKLDCASSDAQPRPSVSVGKRAMVSYSDGDGFTNLLKTTLASYLYSSTPKLLPLQALVMLQSWARLHLAKLRYNKARKGEHEAVPCVCVRVCVGVC